MTWLLIKKQLHEIFKAYYYDAKHNKKRSKAVVTLFFILYILLMVVFVGGIFAFLSSNLCEPFADAGVSWLYFIIMGVMALALGVFGSVFNTYSGLYLAKDNDLLFSLPIPVDSIIISRMMSVYLMGLMYSACVFVPSLIMYWIRVNRSFMIILGGLVMELDISLIVLALSCILGYFIARLSLKLKNKGIITAIIVVLFIGGYYYFYFRFNTLLVILVSNAQQYGAQIKGSARALYLFGLMGEGNIPAILIVTCVCFAITAVVWTILKRSFLKIATSTSAVKKVVYQEKKTAQKSAAGALLSKELRHFTSSTNYMLNCGLGILMLPILGVALVWKGEGVLSVIMSMFGEGNSLVLLCVVLCLAGVMIDPAAPAVSLEGKTLWLAKSLPVTPWQVLKAKLHMQILTAEIPTVFAVICGTVMLLRTKACSPAVVVLFILIPLLFQLFLACWDLFWGTRMANTSWTSEIYPIKQSMPIFLAIFGGAGVAIAIAGLYIWKGHLINLTVYLALTAVILAAASALMIMWLKGSGARKFAALD